MERGYGTGLPARTRPLSAAFELTRLLFPHRALWFAVSCLMAVNLAWIFWNPRFSLAPSILQMVVLLVLTPLVLAYRHQRGAQFDRVQETLVFMLLVTIYAGLFSQQVNLFSHLMMSLGWPLTDARLNDWDVALGFDWNGYASTMASVPWLRTVLYLAYGPLLLIALAVIPCVAILSGRLDRVEEMAFLVLVSGVLCVGIAGLLPAVDAWNWVATPQTRALLGETFEPEWLGHFSALRGSGPVTFDFNQMPGLATFPSFHSCLGIIIIWCSRGRWFTALPGALVGFALLVATPIYGGHYGVDLLGGAAVMAGAILAWRRVAPALLSGRV